MIFDPQEVIFDPQEVIFDPQEAIFDPQEVIFAPMEGVFDPQVIKKVPAGVGGLSAVGTADRGWEPRGIT